MPQLSERSKPDFQPWREEAFRSDLRLRSLTPHQRLMYRALLCAAFVENTRPYLPDDDNWLWLLADADSKEQWLKDKPALMAFFERIEEDGKPLLANPKVSEHWETIAEKRAGILESRSGAGKMGADARWKKVDEDLSDGKNKQTIASDGNLTLTLPLPLTSSSGRVKNSTKPSTALKDMRRIAARKFGDCDTPMPNKRVGVLFEAFGTDAVVESFRLWTLSAGSEYNGMQPIAEWLRAAKRDLAGSTAQEDASAPDSANLRLVTEQIATLTKGAVYVGSRQSPQLARVIVNHGPELTIAAWQAFWADRDTDEEPRFAIHNFLDVAEQRIAVLKNQRAERTNIEQYVDREMDREREGIDARLAEIAAASRREDEAIEAAHLEGP